MVNGTAPCLLNGYRDPRWAMCSLGAALSRYPKTDPQVGMLDVHTKYSVQASNCNITHLASRLAAINETARQLIRCVTTAAVSSDIYYGHLLGMDPKRYMPGPTLRTRPDKG